jgi:molybdopterin-guanine dinucleotide biosynthesis protein
MFVVFHCGWVRVGKTTVIAPLLVMMLADGLSLVTIAVPSALLEQSRVIFMSKFSNVLGKRVYTLDFDR